MPNIQLNLVTKDKAELTNPNFTRNRFDLIYDKNCYFLEYIFEDKTYYIVAHKSRSTLELGIYLMQLSEIEYQNLIKEIFSKFKNIKRLKIAGAINNYAENSRLSKETDYVTYLPATEEEYFQNFSSKFKYNRKREMRILHNDFTNVEIKKYTENIPKEIFNEYFKFKKITHKKNYRMSHEKYIKQYYVTGAYELKLNSKTEAIIFISEIGNHIYVENTTYNTVLNKYGIGTLLLFEMIKDCIAEQNKTLYWGSNHDYKKHFANYSVQTYSGYIYKNRSSLFWKNFFNMFKKH